MNHLWNYYLNLSIRFRLSLLCVCYSLCLLAAGVVCQASSPLVRFGSIATFIILGGLFGWANIWSIRTPLVRAVGYLETMTAYLISPSIRTVPVLLLLVAVVYVRPQGLLGRR